MANNFYLSDREKDYSGDESVIETPVFRKKEIDQAILQARDESKHDRDYKFMSDKTILHEFFPKDTQMVQICSFCNRADEPLIGPFCKFDESKDSQKLIGSPLFFHKDCIEINRISKFSQKEKTWINIGTALQNLVHKYP